ncbi:cytochrome P450 [Sphingobium sp. MK2]|uniref:cytochrome P450 n=1 Tax=Sphingobium sp. MK2 TaxID=3116540 RepID=UPI0032E35C1F
MSKATTPQQSADFPVLSDDMFDPAVLADSIGSFRKIRDMGDVVWSPSLGMFIAGRFADVQKGLRAHEVLISGRGVTVNAALRTDPDQTDPVGVLTMDGEEHARHKRLLMKPLTPKALRDVSDRIRVEAEAVVASVANAQQFEAISSLASHLPKRIVSQLVGLTDVGSEQLLRWAAAAFDGFGPPDNPRLLSAVDTLGEFLAYVPDLTRDLLVPDGWAARLFDAADRSEITEDMARSMIFDYATPALDTTILSIGELLYQLATTPGAFDALQSDPGLITSAVYEAVRLASPIRGFVRYAVQDFTFTTSTIPAGSRIWLLNASANRDERHYDDPDQFDINRNPRDQLGWGIGSHMCAGMHLARLEIETILSSLLDHASRIELAGQPERMVNNGVQGWRKLPITVYPKKLD